MSYTIHTTKGLVLSSHPLREADRVYSILTRELGLVRATATGVRKEASKLRGALEPFVFSEISLVRGKERWRVTSAEVIKKISAVPEVLRPLALLEKLIQGEAPHPELFDAVEKMVGDSGDKNGEFETHLVAEMLFHLGYLKKGDLKLDKKALVKAINNGLDASHLADN